jgi:A1 cistron-splicing factor AAR2
MFIDILFVDFVFYLLDENAFLGEFQFSFVVFLVGESLEGFEQWKLLLQLFTNIDRGIEQYRTFFEQFTMILISQLKEVPNDFFIDVISNNNFLRPCLYSYFEICQQSTITSAHTDLLTKLKQLLTIKFGLNIEQNEDDEYAPVIVE